MEPLKPAKSYEEQIAHLRQAHGLIIDNEEQAVSVLSRVSYYRLSAYGLSLRDPTDPEHFVQGTRFPSIYRLYSFDRLFRALLFAVLAEVEIQFRSRVSYQLAMKYGAEGYLDSNNFQQIIDNQTKKTTHEVTIDRFKKEVKRQASLPCVKHHNTKYGGHFPIWAAIELFTFGMSSTLYKCMLKPDRESIAKEFGVDAKHLESWVLCFVELRNICAHSGRIYNMPLKQTPMLYKDQAAYQANNRLFPVLLALKRVLKGQSIWDVFVSGFAMLSDSFQEADLSKMGFPENWKDVLGVSADAMRK